MNAITLDVQGGQNIGLAVSDGGAITLGVDRPTGTANYNALTNKPLIEGHTLVGNSTIQQIGVDALPVSEIERVLYL